MTRSEFIKELDFLLQELPDKKRLDLLSDYTQHFLKGMQNGKTEAEIAESLGSPEAIAREILARYQSKQAATHAQPVENVARVVFATIALGFVNLVFVLGPLLGVIGVVVALFATSIFLIASPIGLIASAGQPETPDETMLILFASLATVGLGAMLGSGMMFVTKWLYRLFMLYLNLNLRIIRGKSHV